MDPTQAAGATGRLWLRMRSRETYFMSHFHTSRWPGVPTIKVSTLDLLKTKYRQSLEPVSANMFEMVSFDNFCNITGAAVASWSIIGHSFSSLGRAVYKLIIKNLRIANNSNVNQSCSSSWSWMPSCWRNFRTGSKQVSPPMVMNKSDPSDQWLDTWARNT